MTDAQVNWFSKKLNTTFKLGASNVLNQKSYQTYGGPKIGRLAYFSLLYELKKSS
jgi:iron complex outermembrane receptor protein